MRLAGVAEEGCYNPYFPISIFTDELLFRVKGFAETVAVSETYRWVTVSDECRAPIQDCITGLICRRGAPAHAGQELWYRY